MTDLQPTILKEDKHLLSDLEDLKKNTVQKELDLYNDQLGELFLIKNPQSKFANDYSQQLAKFIKEKNSPTEGRFMGTWVYFPWNGYLLHILNENDFFTVRTNRNQNIINPEEQKSLYDFKVAVLGLSIGNGMALNLVYSGISKKIMIADFDTLELSNLNRIRTGIQDLGMPKTAITIRQIYEINPFAEVESFPEGVNVNNISKFISSNSKLIFEAIDDFEIKIRIRMEAKKSGIPVVMLTNLGDRLLIDVERYDLKPDTVIFNGLIGDTADEILSKPISEEDKQKYAVALVGKDNIPTSVLQSVMEVNKTLVGRPQVMSTVTIGGGIAALLARRVAIGPELKSGRYLINFEELIK